MMMPRPICFRLLAQLMRKARSLAFDNAGNNIAARMAMMAMTTSSSINVNPACGRRENLQRFMRNFDLQLWTHIGAMNLRSRFRFLESAAGSLFMVCFQIADRLLTTRRALDFCLPPDSSRAARSGQEGICADLFEKSARRFDNGAGHCLRSSLFA